ncbi:glycosyltransferase [Flavivirga aquatica]|uniref:Glycosyltransferase n=1 Tax=Flavivirga aquatica TaxID=1849968 RepID=A0A1E5TBW3_9FLAO|nr:glycosyltransferase [Flavivirga aquatica]OEK08862.1 glycosyltransferase [Flavivirga aquatica]
MRVLQLIDSLEAGGAERVSVNLANALVSNVDRSFLCTSRKEGVLKESLKQEVGYIFLDRKKTIDINAIRKLKTYIKQHKIDIIHAHSSSFFIATIIKILGVKVKLVWHDHYGCDRFVDKRNNSKALYYCSRYFSYTLSVNRSLEKWTKKYLKTREVNYLPNFAIQDKIKPITKLLGADNKRILHLANLRPQKDHPILLEAFAKINKKYPDWTLHCVGKDFKDDYSKALREQVKTLAIENKVFLYGSKSDINNIIKQCDIGVLSSKSEGLPIALLEYGLAGLPTITTNVGECAAVVKEYKTGLIIEPRNVEALTNSIIKYIEDEMLRFKYANAFKNDISKNYSEESTIKRLMIIYNSILKNK